jgi:hypothetical protein
MKYATHDTGVIQDEQGNLVGINLGWDFTAEHEWGTKGIKSHLGVNDKGYGPDRYMIRNLSTIRTQEYVVKPVEKGKKKETWYVITSYKYTGDVTQFLPSYYRAETGVMSAWAGDSGFVVAIKDKAVYEAIMDALTAGNAIITNDRMFASEQNPFSGNGLKIVIRSAIPSAWETLWVESHKDRERLLAASEATGIEKKLKAAGKNWYALSPSWLSTARKSVHKVMYWLNPMEQDKNNYGWFTVEDLELWAKNEGPIPMSKAANKA